MQLSIAAAPAASDPQRWDAYVTGHGRILQKMGIHVLSSAGHDWIQNPHVYLVSLPPKIRQEIKVEKA
ncbi:MAG: hypothetical protein OHK0039_46620 [Bacteroidia bacterium]